MATSKTGAIYVTRYFGIYNGRKEAELRNYIHIPRSNKFYFPIKSQGQIDFWSSIIDLDTHYDNNKVLIKYDGSGTLTFAMKDRISAYPIGTLERIDSTEKSIG